MATLNFKFYLTIGSSNIEAHPLNFLQSMLIDELEENQAFYRRKFSGTLTFDNLVGDFDILWQSHQADPCSEILLNIQKSGNDYWQGFFTPKMGIFDLDRCTFKITPQPHDDYVDLLNNSDAQYNILINTIEIVTTRALMGTIDRTYDRNRWLINIIQFLADKIKPGVNVSSHFFTDATNYVTQVTNHLTLLTIAQKSDIIRQSDIIRPTSKNPATYAPMSWDELMEILWGMFQVQWNYNPGTNTINVEHISWFTSSPGLDLRTQLLSVATNKFDYLKIKMPKYEKFAWMEANNASFIGSPIWYDSNYVNQDPKTNVKETSVKVTTDLDYIIRMTEAGNQKEISDDGFVILCNYEDGGDYFVELESSAVGSEIRLNMHLSWTNLEHRYFRHNRVLIEGYMNNNLITFWSGQKNMLQKISAKVCTSVNYDPANEITTELGETYLGGAKASVKQAELSPSGLMRFELLYGPAAHTPSAITDQPWIMIYEVTGASKSTFYAVCSNPTTIALTLHIYLTCIDAGSNMCDTANFDLDIAMGNTTGNIEVPWCEDSICIGAYHPDSSEAVVDGWVIDWIYDVNSRCV